MDELKAQQMEALEVVSEYIEKLLPNMNILSNELKGNRQEDTDTFLNYVMNGFNWVIEVFNVTRDYINADKIRIDKEEVNEKIIELSKAFKEKDDEKAAELIETAVIPFLNTFLEVSKELTK